MQSLTKLLSSHAGYLIPGGCAAALIGHMLLLQRNELDWISSPISDLSLHGNAGLHTLALLPFALSQALVAARVEYDRAGHLTRCIQILSVLNALLIASLGYLNALDRPTWNTAFLFVISSNTGIMMSLILAMDIARGRKLRSLLISAGLLAIWVLLIPVFFILNIDVVGAYQRTVALVYLVWLVTIAGTRTQ